jgi:hypothetical protein
MITTPQDLLSQAYFHSHSLPDHGVELRVHEMDYPFLHTQVFSPHAQDMYEDFQGCIHHLAKMYMLAWIHERGEGLEKHFHSVFNFQSSTDLKEVFAKIVNREDSPAYILLPVSNARLKVRRFGNCLGMKLLANNNRSDEIHVDGTKIMEGLCRRNDSWVIEFKHSFEYIIPLPKKQGENNSVIVDFGRVYSQIKKACPYLCLHENDFHKGILDEYAFNPGNGPVGYYHCQGKIKLDILIDLLHYYNHTDQKTIQWRRGNLDLNGPDYRFLDGRDLCLSLKVSSSFPQNTFLKPFDTDLNLIAQQNKLLLASATLYSQLSAMVANGVFKD